MLNNINHHVNKLAAREQAGGVGVRSPFVSFRMRGKGGTLKGHRAEGGEGEYRQKGAARRER